LCAQRVAEASTATLQYGQGRVAGVSPAGAGLMIHFVICQASIATIAKLSSAPRKAPSRIGFASGPGPRGNCQVIQPPPGVMRPMIGMMKPSTMAWTTLLVAVPTTTASASASMFCLTRKDLNSCHGDMGISCGRFAERVRMARNAGARRRPR